MEVSLDTDQRKSVGYGPEKISKNGAERKSVDTEQRKSQ